MRRREFAGMSLLASAMLSAHAPCLAQVERQGGGNANAMLQQQYQQANAARNALQAENAQLKQKAEQLQQQLDAAVKQQAAAKRQLNGLQQQQSRDTGAANAQTEANEKLQAQLRDVIEHYRELVAQLKGVEAERADLQAKTVADARNLATCADHNAQMYLLSQDILDHMEHGGFWSAVKNNEPFVRLSRTRLENLADDYRQRIGELRLQQLKGSTAASGSGAGSRDASMH